MKENIEIILNQYKEELTTKKEEIEHLEHENKTLESEKRNMPESSYIKEKENIEQLIEKETSQKENLQIIIDTAQNIINNITKIKELKKNKITDEIDAEMITEEINKRKEKIKLQKEIIPEELLIEIEIFEKENEEQKIENKEKKSISVSKNTEQIITLNTYKLKIEETQKEIEKLNNEMINLQKEASNIPSEEFIKEQELISRHLLQEKQKLSSYQKIIIAYESCKINLQTLNKIQKYKKSIRDIKEEKEIELDEIKIENELEKNLKLLPKNLKNEIEQEIKKEEKYKDAEELRNNNEEIKNIKTSDEKAEIIPYYRQELSNIKEESDIFKQYLNIEDNKNQIEEDTLVNDEIENNNQKIVAIRSPKFKDRIKKILKLASPIVAAILLAIGIKSSNKTPKIKNNIKSYQNIEDANKEDEIIESIINENIDEEIQEPVILPEKEEKVTTADDVKETTIEIGTRIKIYNESKIYKTAQDSILEENAYNPYYDNPNDERIVLGVSVSYNDSIYNIFACTPEANNKIRDLINLGGTIESVLTGNVEHVDELKKYDKDIEMTTTEINNTAEGWYNINSVVTNYERGLKL